MAVLPQERKAALAAFSSINSNGVCVYLRTWGCSHNNSDSEYMQGLLAAAGFMITQQKADADVWLLNGCTVKNPSQDTFVNEVVGGLRAGKFVVLAGCVSQAQPDLKEFENCSIIGVKHIDRVVEVVEETMKGNCVRYLKATRTAGAALNLPKQRKNRFVEIIPINTGCLNQCTYCKTKFARGDLRSYSINDIVSRVIAVANEGVKEIWLTSEDLGAYGRDINTSIADLMDAILQVLPPNILIRCGMTNPPYILEHMQVMARVLNHPQVYAFIHIPVQCGSDEVLQAMNRQYSVADFCRLVDYLTAQVPEITLATDIICGFPTETSDDFKQTLALIERYKFPIINISQFYPRPGTPAASLRRLSTLEVKERSRQVTRLFESYLTRDRNMGRQYVNVLVTDEATDGKNWVGHNKSYDQILIPKSEGNLLGEFVTVKIVDFGKHFMTGQLICVQSQMLTRKSRLSFFLISAIVALVIAIIVFFC